MASALSEDARTRDIRLSNSRLLPLRVLYTINSSPQYILARSHKPVTISPIPRRPPLNSYYLHTFHDPATQNPPEELHATASLKICLDAICRSSPELVQDDSRDFSVYVLDPLESQSTPAPVNIPADASRSNTDKSATAATDQHPRGVAVGLGLMSWALLADEEDCVSVTGTLIAVGNGQEALQVIFALRETASMQKAALSTTVKSWGLPPPPSKRTRVHASKSHHSSKHTPNQASSSFQSSHGSFGSTSSQLHNASTIYSKKHPTSEARKSLPSGATTSDFLDSHSVYIGPPKRPVGRPETGRGKAKANKKDNQPENPPFVLTPLVRHDNSSSTSQGPEVSQPISQTVNEEPLLANLLAAISSSGQNAALLSALSTIDSSSASPSSHPSDRQTNPPNPALINALKQLLSMACPQTPSSLTDNSANSTIATLPKAEKSQDDDIVLLDKENVNPTAFRRRGEREDTKSPTTITAVSSAGRAGLSLGCKENSSPASATRKRTLSEFMDERENDTRHRRIDSSSSQPRGSSRPQTSPSRPIHSGEGWTHFPLASLSASPQRPRKRFVVPDWAKTETATLPRLSKEAEAHAAMAPEAKGKKTKRTKAGDGRRWGHASRKASEDPPAKPRDGSEAESSHSESQRTVATSIAALPQLSEKAPDPVPAAHHFPVFASDICVGTFPSSLPCPTSSPPANFETPKTPKRRAMRYSPSTRHDNDKIPSLFTPTPRCGLSDGSPLFTPGFRTMVGLARQASPTPAVPPVKKVWEGLKQTEETPNREPQVSSEDLDFPPSSLPIATSDFDIQETNLSEDQDFGQDHAMQHWSGLPPSSPPPPSSPILLSLDDEKMDDLPSIADALPSTSSGHSDFDFSSSGENLEMSFDDFNRLFSDSDSQAFLPLGSSDGMINPPVQNGVTDFDFTEFWESVKPLVEGEGEKVIGTQDDSSLEMGGVDHVKLAEEVQALFSGCLM